MRGSASQPPAWAIARGEAGYPAPLTLLGRDAPQALSFLGKREIWFEGRSPRLGLAASIRCPGEVILATYDLAIALRRAGVEVIGGFHSPMEHEALRLLLRGRQPVILCPARSLQRMRIKPEYRQPLAEGRLLLLSLFAANVRRATAESATLRNRIVAALADALLVVHAQPEGKAEALVHEALAWGKRVYTLDLAANRHLLAAGAEAFDLEAWQKEAGRT